MDNLVLRRLEAIEQRLLALETRFNPAPEPVPSVDAPVVSADPPVLPAIEPPAAVFPPPLPPFASAVEAVDGPPMGDAYHNQRLTEKMERLENWQRTMPPPLTSRKMDFDLERAVGLRWAGWIGAVVLMIGAVLGVKYAYDRGWLGGVPDALRTVMIAMAGVALIGLGEFIYRRVHRLAATGPYAAGVGVLFLAVYAAQAWYGLLGPVMSVVLLACVTATGMLLAARAELVSIAALSIVCAIVCPFGMGAADRPRGELLAYLLAIQAMAVGLSAWRATPRWWVLRGLALATTTIGQLALLRPALSPGQAIDVVAVIFAIGSALIYQFELVYTTLRRPGTGLANAATGVCYSLLVTVTLTIELLACFDAHSRVANARVLLALSVVTVGLARLRVLPKLAAIGRGFFVQSTLLAAVAVPVWLDGPAMLFAWIALAGGLAAVALFNRDRFPAGAAAMVWTFAAIASINWAIDVEAAKQVWFVISGQDMSVAVVVAVVLSLAGHLTATAVQRAWPVAESDLFGPSAALPIDIMAVLAFAAILGRHLPGTVATQVELIYALMLWAASYAPALSRLGFVAIGGLSVLAVKWVVVDALVPRLTRGWRPEDHSLLNSQSLTGIAIAAAFALIGRTARQRLLRAGGNNPERADYVWAGLLTVAVVTVGVAASFEIDRVIQRDGPPPGSWPTSILTSLLLTLLWTGCVAAWTGELQLTITTDTVRRDVVRCCRLLAYVLAVKFVVVDVLNVAATWPKVDAALLWNLRTLVLGAVVALVVWADRARGDLARGPGTGLIVLGLLLFTGTAEIDRYADRQTDSPPWIVRQVGWSIYWSALAGVSLVLGFVRRRRPLRLAALGLLAVTLVKVTLVDLAGVDTGWRILSFLGLGGLLLLTSVLYGRFELNVQQEAEPAEAPA